MDLRDLAEAPVVEAGEDASGTLLLRPLFQLRLAVLGDGPEVGLGVQELLQEGRPLAAERLRQLGTRPASMSRYLEQRLRQSGLGGQMGRAEEFLLALPNRTMRIPVIAKTMVTIVTRDGLHLANGSGVGAEMGRYHFVEGIALADCAIDVEGAGVADLFETARRRAN